MSREPMKAWLLRRLDNWKFWITLFGFALILVIVWLVGVSGKTNREIATRRATESSNATNAYRQCVASRPTLTKLNTHLRGVNDLAETLTLNNIAIVSATAAADPQYLTRQANLRRIRTAAIKIAAVKELPVPSVADCLKLRPRD